MKRHIQEKRILTVSCAKCHAFAQSAPDDKRKTFVKFLIGLGWVHYQASGWYCYKCKGEAK